MQWSCFILADNCGQRGMEDMGGEINNHTFTRAPLDLQVIAYRKRRVALVHAFIVSTAKESWEPLGVEDLTTIPKEASSLWVVHLTACMRL